MADKKTVKFVAELRALDSEALIKKVAELRAQLVEQQRAHAAGELPNPRAIRNLRKQIAKVLTVQAEQAAKAEEK